MRIRPSDIRPSEITPEAVWRGRRQFVGAALGSALGARLGRAWVVAGLSLPKAAFARELEVPNTFEQISRYNNDCEFRSTRK